MLRSEALAEVQRVKAAQEGFELKILDYLRRNPNDVFGINDLRLAILTPLYPTHENHYKMIPVFVAAVWGLIRAGSVESIGDYFGLKK